MPQQRRAQVTRRAIVIAAAEEFDRLGYAAATLGAILRQSGVTKGAFYFHFVSKDAVAETLVQEYERSCSRLWHRWWHDSGSDPLSMAIGLTGDVARLFERDVVVRAGMRVACQRDGGGGSAACIDWQRLLARLLWRSAELGQLRAEIDPMAAARVVYGALLGMWSWRSDRAGLADRVNETWQVLLAGLVSSESSGFVTGQQSEL